MSSFDSGSDLAAIRLRPVAMLSFRTPMRPLGSAAVTAIPESITLSRTCFHSSGVKVVLLAMADLLTLRPGTLGRQPGALWPPAGAAKNRENPDGASVEP